MDEQLSNFALFLDEIAEVGDHLILKHDKVLDVPTMFCRYLRVVTDDDQLRSELEQNERFLFMTTSILISTLGLSAHHFLFLVFPATRARDLSRRLKWLAEDKYVTDYDFKQEALLEHLGIEFPKSECDCFNCTIKYLKQISSLALEKMGDDDGDKDRFLLYHPSDN